MPISAIRGFLKLQSAGGVLLVVAAVIALICANLPGLSSLYESFLNVPITVQLGALVLKKNVLLVINDGLMAVFFLLVALELKREMLEGELSRLRQIVLPGAAALGGLATPALIYAWFNWGDAETLRGWAIPAATDIAFSLGVLSLLGGRVPLAIKVFLTTLAVIDDLAAILIIAAFYTENLSLAALAWAGAGVVGLVVMNQLGVKRIAAFMLVGVFIWVCVLKSGIHATLAGVLVGLAVPMRVRGEPSASPLRHLEHTLHPWVAFGILPLFAFANAGVSFGGNFSSALDSTVTHGIAGGLLVGKTLGVFGCSWLVIQLGLAVRPGGCGWGALLGVAMLTGIGFTMSLFIGTLAFEGGPTELAAATRIGVLGGSLVSALLGYAMLALTLPRTHDRL